MLVARGSAEQVQEAARGNGGSLVVYLGEGIGEPVGRQIASQLAGLPGVQRAEFVAASESANRLAQALSSDAELFEGLDPATLPASIEAILEPGALDVIAMSPTLRALRDTAGVVDVVVEATDRDPRSHTRDLNRGGVGTIALLILAIAAIIAIAVMRIWLERDLETDRVLDLLGAPRAVFAAPSLLAGALLSSVAALLAAIIVGIGVANYGELVGLAAPSWAACFSFIPGGAVAGVVAGGFAGAPRAS
jgi:cell division protein FtsX